LVDKFLKDVDTMTIMMINDHDDAVVATAATIVGDMQI